MGDGPRMNSDVIDFTKITNYTLSELRELGGNTPLASAVERILAAVDEDGLHCFQSKI